MNLQARPSEGNVDWHAKMRTIGGTLLRMDHDVYVQLTEDRDGKIGPGNRRGNVNPALLMAVLNLRLRTASE